MKSIRGKILFWFSTTSVLLLFVLGIIIYTRLTDTVVPLIENMSLEILKGRSDQLAGYFDSMKKELKVYSEMDFFRNSSKEEIADYLVKRGMTRTDRYEMIFYSDGKGQTVTSHPGLKTDLYDRDYFKNIIGGKSDFELTNPVISKTTGNLISVIALPVKDEKGKVTGLIGASLLLDTISGIAGSISVGDAGYGFIVDGTGMLIAHPEESMIMNLNLLDSKELGYDGLDDMARKMIRGGEGFQEVKSPDNSLNLNFFLPIEGTPNWSLGVAVPMDQLRKTADDLIVGIVFILLMIIGVMILISIFIGNRISKPIKRLSDMVVQFGHGDLTVDFSLQGKDEVAKMASGLEEMAGNLRNSMVGIKGSSDNILASSARLDGLAASSENHSVELVDRMAIVDSNVQDSSASIQEVSSSIEEVAASAQNVSKIAQELAENSNATATDAKKGENSLLEMVDMIKMADTQTRDTARIVEILAQQAINVQEIVDSISTIAEQTNLLALNAAIEAARAGDAGKGFAVVADEIRKLAEESKNSAGNIEKILREIKAKSEGANKSATITSAEVVKVNEKAGQTLSQFKNIILRVENISTMVENLAGAAEEQSAAAEEMASAMDQSSKSSFEVSAQVQEITNMTGITKKEAVEIKDAANGLKVLSNALKEGISKFKIS